MPRKQLLSKVSLYSVHPSIAYRQAVAANLPRTTGKSIDEWARVIKKSGPSDERACTAWLKKDHKLGGTSASVISQHVFGTNSGDTDPEAYMRSAPQWVEAMYAGPKSALRPIHDDLIRMGQSMGDDEQV